MSEPAIIVRNLSKRYRLGVIGRNTLRDEMIYRWHKLLGRDPAQHMGKVTTRKPVPVAATAAEDDPNSFWAIRDVSFEIQHGEVIGIVGRNGAGKSTLLKILTRITQPTSGEADINGRVGSLLEVGTGFHPEFTGRENIYMNGTILGMKKREIDRRFDEIVAFAEIEQFLDTPVKRYSSGMYVRLAFAVAAHLESEILLVDEVLAVGDTSFQKKCLGKMGEVARKGRTVLFVSHNMAAIRNLCQKTILVVDGRTTGPLETTEAMRKYLRGALKETGQWINPMAHEPGRRTIEKIEISQHGNVARETLISEPITFSFVLSDTARQQPCLVGLMITNSEGVIVHHSLDIYDPTSEKTLSTGNREAVIPPHALAPGEYTLSCSLGHPQESVWDSLPEVLRWNVIGDCPRMMQFPAHLWKGAAGPGMVTWTHLQDDNK